LVAVVVVVAVVVLVVVVAIFVVVVIVIVVVIVLVVVVVLVAIVVLVAVAVEVAVVLDNLKVKRLSCDWLICAGLVISCLIKLLKGAVDAKFRIALWCTGKEKD